MLRSGQILFTYLHLAADRAQADALMAAGVTAIAYETVTAAGGGLPLLAPMSEVAGRMAVQVGAKCLEKEAGGIGKLLGGVPGVAPAKVVILGGGTAGANAALIALGMQADVNDSRQVGEPVALARGPIRIGLARGDGNAQTIHEYVVEADLVIRRGAGSGCGGAETRESRDGARNARRLGCRRRPRSTKAACFETSRPTTHSAPTYIEEGWCTTASRTCPARSRTRRLSR